LKWLTSEISVKMAEARKQQFCQWGFWHRKKLAGSLTSLDYNQSKLVSQVKAPPHSPLVYIG